MVTKNPGRLAIHRRSDEIVFLQERLRSLELQTTPAPAEKLSVDRSERDIQQEALLRQQELADELLHTRQIEPLGEALQRRLAMAERIRRDLTPSDVNALASGQWTGGDALRLAEIDRLALSDMLQHWWAWLREA
jgi:hypothetical protein